MRRYLGLRECVAALGLALLATGLALWSLPLALVVVGVLFLVAAVAPLFLVPRGGGGG